MSYKPGDTRIGGFTTQRFDTGAATDADSLPAVTVTKNGADEGGAGVTVSKLDTGRYKYSYTIDAGWAAGDRIQDFVAATVNSVAGKACVGDFVLDKRVNDLTDVTAAQVKAALETEGGLLAWLRDVDEGDIYIDTTTTPWQLEIRLKGTDEALITKELRQVDGVAVTSASHLVALHTEPAP
jgi:hypothetical protein